MIVSITGVLLALACVGQCQLDPNLLSADLCLKRLDKEQWNTFALPANLRMDRFAMYVLIQQSESMTSMYLTRSHITVAKTNYPSRTATRDSLLTEFLVWQQTITSVDCEFPAAATAQNVLTGRNQLPVLFHQLTQR